MSEGESDTDKTVLALAEERLTVAKRRVVTGRVRLRVETLLTEEPVSAELLVETVEVTRVPIDREVTEVPQTRIEGDVTIVPVLEEVLVVERKLILREEVHLRRVSVSEAVETAVPLRRQHVVIEREGPMPEGTVPLVNPINEDENDERL